jgi:predicted nucleic acid-binding protein
MAYKLFIDSDILLDVLLIRQPHFESSVSIFYLREKHQVELFTSPSIILNTNYIAQKQSNKKRASEGVVEILKTVEIIETTKKILVDCFNNKHLDVKDAVQYFTALQNNSVNYYITRNVKHFVFKNMNLPVLTPTQFLKHIIQNP